MDVSRLAEMGWRSTITLDAGIPSTYRDYLANIPTHEDQI